MKIECHQCNQLIKMGKVSTADFSCPHCGSDLNDGTVHESIFDRIIDLIGSLFDYGEQPRYYVATNADEEGEGPYTYESLELMWERSELKGSNLLRKGGEYKWIEVNKTAPKFSVVKKGRRRCKIFGTLAVVSGVGSYLCKVGAEFWMATPEMAAIRNAGKMSLTEGPLLLGIACMALGVLAFIFAVVAACGMADWFGGKRSLAKL